MDNGCGDVIGAVIVAVAAILWYLNAGGSVPAAGGGDTNVAVNITYTGTAESLGGVKAAVKSALAEVEAERGRRNYKGA